jgi:uncharacterized protein (TIGR03083 family)
MGSVESLLRSQWQELRAWLGELDIELHGGAPSVLAGWTVRQLVAHLGYGLVMLDEISEAPMEFTPIQVGEYIAGYSPAASDIRAATCEVAAGMSDVLSGLDEMAARAWKAVSGASRGVVLGRRGALTYDDYLLTRLIELVVHGDDLSRSLKSVLGHEVPPPLVPAAVDEVAGAFRAAYELRSGSRIEFPDLLPWIRVATGRVASPDPYLPLL